MWKHANKNRHKNNTQFSEHFRKKSPSQNTRIAFQSIKISKFSRIACFQTPLVARTLGAHVIRRLFKNTSRLYVLTGWTVWLLKTENEKFTRWFSIFDSFDHLPPVLAADTEKSAPKSKTSGTLGIQEGKKNIEQTLKLHQIWTGLWAPDSDYWITATWSRIRNLSLNTADIYCNKLERILLPFYIFIERRGGKWTFCNLGAWFWPNFRANRLYERKVTWKYKFGSVMSYWKETRLFSGWRASLKNFFAYAL